MSALATVHLFATWRIFRTIANHSESLGEAKLMRVSPEYLAANGTTPDEVIAMGGLQAIADDMRAAARHFKIEFVPYTAPEATRRIGKGRAR
jgi:hypothetical protein